MQQKQRKKKNKKETKTRNQKKAKKKERRNKEKNKRETEKEKVKKGEEKWLRQNKGRQNALFMGKNRFFSFKSKQKQTIKKNKRV